MTTETQLTPSRRLRRIVAVILIVLVAIVVIVYIAFQISPLPSVWLIRNLPNGDALDAAEQTDKYVPAEIASMLDEVYAPGDPDGVFDVFYPEGATEPLPTIVWVHGGGFIGGTKNALRSYMAILASHGYTVVNVEYTHAPEALYPTPVIQLNQALAHITEQAERLHVDPQQIVLAGDSAGAHIAAQAALAITNPDYARDAQLPAAIDAAALRGVILVSGPYDTSSLDFNNATFGWFMSTVLWAYTGDKNFMDEPRSAYLSLPPYVTADYPPALITTGPYDPLLSHSQTLVNALSAQGVDVDALFFDAETTDESIGHEYQLQLDAPEAKEALKHMIAFMREYTATPDVREGVSDGW